MKLDSKCFLDGNNLTACCSGLLPLAEPVSSPTFSKFFSDFENIFVSTKARKSDILTRFFFSLPRRSAVGEASSEEKQNKN